MLKAEQPAAAVIQPEPVVVLEDATNPIKQSARSKQQAATRKSYSNSPSRSGQSILDS